MNLLEARLKLAADLAPAAEGDPTVLVSLVDSIEPPALMLGWGEPMLEPLTACNRTGRLVVTAVASRLEPGEGIAMLEELVEFTLGRLTPAWPLELVDGPRGFTVAGLNYLATRIHLTTTIN